MGEKIPTMQIQPKIQENPTSLMQEKPEFVSPESDDHQQPQPQQQQQQQKRPNESNNEEQGKSTNTRGYENGGKYEQESKEKINGDHNNSNNNGGNLGPRERLKRHRREVAGQVWIPDMWGQEDFLKDWIDCSSFDASLVPQGIMLARASLMEEGRRSNSNTLRVENSC